MGDGQTAPSRVLDKQIQGESFGNKGHEGERKILEGNKHGKGRDQ